MKIFVSKREGRDVHLLFITESRNSRDFYGGETAFVRTYEIIAKTLTAVVALANSFFISFYHLPALSDDCSFLIAALKNRYRAGQQSSSDDYGHQ